MYIFFKCCLALNKKIIPCMIKSSVHLGSSRSKLCCLYNQDYNQTDYNLSKKEIMT